jgi:hypothetical protein
MGNMPPDAMAAMSPAQTEMMPSQADMDLAAEQGGDAGAWGDGAAAGGSPLDGMAPMGGDGMAPMGGDPMGDFTVGADGGIGGGPPPGPGDFGDAMAAMDGAASANMAEGMDAANTAADAADAAGADAPADNAPTDDVV